MSPDLPAKCHEEAHAAVGPQPEPVSANLDLVGPIYANWERGDFSNAEWAPDIEFVRPDGPEPGTWRGIPEISQTTRDILPVWHDFRQVPGEFQEIDAERVLVLLASATLIRSDEATPRWRKSSGPTFAK
jgi:hypothetical protein